MYGRTEAASNGPSEGLKPLSELARLLVPRPDDDASAAWEAKGATNGDAGGAQQRQASLAPWSAVAARSGQERRRRDIVLVQGPAGSGKSLFAWSLYSRFGQHATACSRCQRPVARFHARMPADAKTAPKHSVIPVFISLPLFADLLNDPSERKRLLPQVFSELLIECPALSLFENDRFLFIFDGLDELGLRDFNLFDDCRLQPWASHSMFVVTSRLGFLSEVSAIDRCLSSSHRCCRCCCL